MKKSSCAETEFSCFLEIICEVPFQMMKLSSSRLLKTFHQDFWIWLLNLSPRRKSLTRKNCFLMGTSHIKPCLSRKVGCHLASSQAISAFFDGSQCFWYAVAVGGSDDFVHLWLLIFVPSRSENKLQLISVSFPKNCCLAEFQSEIILWIVGFQLLEDFFVLNQWKGLLAWTRSFRVFWR